MIAEVPALRRGRARRLRRQAARRARARPPGEIRYPIKDFYLTNPIARASGTMQRCSAELLHGEELAEAAE